MMRPFAQANLPHSMLRLLLQEALFSGVMDKREVLSLLIQCKAQFTALLTHGMVVLLRILLWLPLIQRRQ